MTTEQKTDEQKIAETYKAIGLALDHMQQTYDARLLVHSLLARAAAISEMLIRSGHATEAGTIDLYATACGIAVTPLVDAKPILVKPVPEAPAKNELN